MGMRCSKNFCLSFFLSFLFSSPSSSFWEGSSLPSSLLLTPPPAGNVRSRGAPAAGQEQGRELTSSISSINQSFILSLSLFHSPYLLFFFFSLCVDLSSSPLPLPLPLSLLLFSLCYRSWLASRRKRRIHLPRVPIHPIPPRSPPHQMTSLISPRPPHLSIPKRNLSSPRRSRRSSL